MHRKLLGIAIIALLPFSAVHAAKGGGCPQVKQAVDGGADLKTAMESAVSSGACSAAQAANAGYSLSQTAADRQIVRAFKAANGVGGDWYAGDVIGGNITMNLGGVVGGSGGGGGAASGD